MPDGLDYDLLKSQNEAVVPYTPPISAVWWITVTALIAGTALAAYVAFFSQQTTAPAIAPEYSEAPQQRS